jgi:hypothetical protein
MRRWMALVLVAGCLGLVVAPAPAGAAGVIYPTGSRIGLEPPGGLIVSKTFPGFEDASANVKITLLDLPGQTYEAFEKSAFSDTSKTLTVEKREMFAFNGGIGFLITGHEDANGTTFRSWYLLANTSTKDTGQIAAMVGVRVPQAAQSKYPDEVVRAALASVSFRKPPVDELLAMLPFKLTNTAGFRTAKVAPQGAMVLVDGPTDDISKHAYMIVSIGRGAPLEPNGRPMFARDLLTRSSLPGLTITSGEPIRINGAQGFEIRGKAKGPNGEPVALVQWLRFGGNKNFLRILGVVPQDAWDEMFPRFRTVRDGIEGR